MLSDELALYAVKYGKSLGVDFLEARAELVRSQTFIMKNGVLDATGYDVKEGIGIRVLHDGSLSFVTVEDLTKEKIKDAVEYALKLAKSSERKDKIKFSKEKSSKAKWTVKEKEKLDDVSLKDKIDFLKNVDGSMKSSKFRFIQFSIMASEKFYANTDGSRIRSFIPRLSLFYSFIIKEKKEVQRMLELGGSGGWEVTKSWKLDERVNEEVNALRKISEARKIKPRKMDLILSPEVVGIIMHESVGHPSEADRIFGREAAQAGESYMDKSWLKKKISKDFVNVVDDPTVKGSYGYFAYDDEGIKTRRKFLIKKGKIYEFLHNRETASIMKTKSNGSSRAEIYFKEPIIRMSNTFMLPGDHSFEELIEDIKKGVYIKSYNEWNIDDKRWNEKYVGCEAYLIENGEIKEPIFAPVLEITTGQFFKKIDALGNDFDIVAGECGKGEPMQGVPVTMGGPHVRLRNVLIK